MSDKQMFVRLENVLPGHSKFYEVWVEGQGSSCKVYFQYGRIGTAGVMGTKTPNPVSSGQASKIYNDLISEKQAKGYEKTGSKKQPIPLQPMVKLAPLSQIGLEDVPTGGMMPTAVHLSDLDQYINDPEWFAQEKMNGKFMRIAKSHGSSVLAFNKLTKQITLPADIAMALNDYTPTIAADGELIGDKLYLFDIIKIGNFNLVNTPANVRHNTHLVKAVQSIGSKNIVIVEAEFTQSDKEDLVARMKKKNMEGVVFKRINGYYIPGKTENLNKAAIIKIKFWKEVSAYIVEWNDKNSVKLALAGSKSSMVGDKKDLVPCGNVTIPEKYKSEVKPGRILRVKYLYATKDGILYQPSVDSDDDGEVTRSEMDWPDHVSMLKFEGKADEPKLKRNIIV